jgi:hypothetical protein
MDIHLEPAILQFLIVLVAALTASTALGLKRGWKGQLMAFLPIVSSWALLGAKGDALLSLVNVAYKGLQFFASCSGEADSSACAQASDVTTAILVDPSSPDQARLLFLTVFVLTVLLAFLFVMRFGRKPASVVQRLMGAVLGIANGFTLSYLLLPMLPYRQQIPLPVAASAAEGDLPGVAQSFPGSISIPHVSVGVVLLTFLVAFVILAVRLIRPTEPQQ